MNSIRPALRTFGAFLRTPTLSRSIIALLALAILLLLAVNAATFVMIQRTSAYNDTVDHSQQVRLASKDMLSLLADAETGQRGFMLTARAEYLGVHNRAVAELPTVLARLEDLIGDDEELKSRIVRVETLYHQRMALMDRTIALTRTGRIGEAVSLIRSGQGKTLMDQMRIELTAIDAVEARRLVERTRQSERASAVTVSVNALAGVLILILAGISVWLVRRYVEEIEAAHLELDRVNAGLENQVRDRTADLTRANEEIQRFAYIVSHDLRAPLVNVMGYTSELEQVGKIFDHQLTTLAQTHPDAIEPEAIRAVREDVP
jgi:CHASE3 domain sensor protein